MDQYWLDYVTSIAAGVDPAVYDATAYCPPFCDDHLGYPYLYYASYTEFDEQEETSMYGQFDYNVNEKLTLTVGIRDYEIDDASKTYQYGILYVRFRRKLNIEIIIITVNFWCTLLSHESYKPLVASPPS